MFEITELKPVLQRAFEELLHRMLAVMEERYERYGPQNIHDQGIKGICARIRDKLARIEHTEENGDTSTDAWIDLCNYALIGFAKHSGTWPLDEEAEGVTANDLPLGLALPALLSAVDHGAGRLVYLASPYDFGKVESRRGVITTLTKHGWSIFSPVDAFYHSATSLPIGTGQIVRTINELALSLCSAVLLIVDPRRFSYGSVQESIEAAAAGKPVVVLCEQRPGLYMNHLPWADSAEKASLLLAISLDEEGWNEELHK